MTWFDDAQEGRGRLYNEPKEAMEGMVEEGLPPPEYWDSYDVYIDENEVTGVITADGIEYSFTDSGIDLTDLGDWDWVWDIWDWILEWDIDIDMDSHYAQH